MNKITQYLTPRIKNYGFWVSLLSLVPLVLNAFGIEVVRDSYTEATNVILTILITLGIVSNPTTESKWYRDDQ